MEQLILSNSAVLWKGEQDSLLDSLPSEPHTHTHTHTHKSLLFLDFPPHTRMASEESFLQKDGG